MTNPSIHQLQKHIQKMAADSANVAVTKHAMRRMEQRHITWAMMLDVLQKGIVAIPPEPDIKHGGMNCRMVRYVAGVNVGVVVSVEYPAPDLVVVTVIDISKE